MDRRTYSYLLHLPNDVDDSVQDFDSGLVGQSVIAGLTTSGSTSRVTWTVVAAEQFPNGVSDVSHAVLEEKTWIAVTSTPSPPRLLTLL